MFTRAYWAQVAERAVKTFCQAAAALLVGDGLGVVTVDWWHVLDVAALAALVSVLTSVASAPFGERGTPSVLDVSQRK